MKANKRKHIGILGAGGLVGSDLVTYLQKDFRVTPITRQNYRKNIGKLFDVLINANGNSKRYWAYQNPDEDFVASTISVVNSFSDFRYRTYIYLSSVDVYENRSSPKHTIEDQIINSQQLDPYGLHKYLAEVSVRTMVKKYLIFRLSSVLGSNLKKGPIFDLLREDDLHISVKSQLQLITTSALAEVINKCLKKGKYNHVFNVGGRGAVLLSDVQKILSIKKQKISKNPIQIYEMNVKKLIAIYPNLKTSTEYLSEFLDSYVS